MMLDWAVSLLVVSLIVFGLVAVSVDYFDNVNHDYVLRDGLQSTSQTVSDQVDRLEGLPEDVSQQFLYPNPNVNLADGVDMPNSIADSQYLVEFTHDFVVLVSNNSGPTVGAYEALSEPIHLVPQNMTQQLAGFWPISGYHLHTLDQTYDCSAFPVHADFEATTELVTVDGLGTYLTFVYATPPVGSPSPTMSWNYPCT